LGSGVFVTDRLSANLDLAETSCSFCSYDFFCF